MNNEKLAIVTISIKNIKEYSDGDFILHLPEERKEFRIKTLNKYLKEQK